MRRVYYEGRQKPDGQFYWFEDNRTGCEKQTVYFERIRQLESELITKEQKHLVGALERLNQLKYPRRKPVVLDQNWKRLSKYQPKSRRNTFDDRRKLSDESVLSLSAKQMEIYVNKEVRAITRSEIESPRGRVYSSRKIGKTPTNEQGTRNYNETNFFDGIKTNLGKAPIHDVFLPSLPCIPNVGHKTNIEIENKLRILEIANGEFQQCSQLSNGSRRNKKRTAKERKCNHDSATEIVEQHVSNQSDNPTPVLAVIFDETPSQKEFHRSSCDDSGRQQEIGKSVTQTRHVEFDTTNAKQPPPTRRNSQKSTS